MFQIIKQFRLTASLRVQIKILTAFELFEREHPVASNLVTSEPQMHLLWDSQIVYLMPTPILLIQLQEPSVATPHGLDYSPCDVPLC